MRRNTQRVRKALKLNVPIATPEFIADGIGNRAIPDAALYKVTPATSTKVCIHELTLIMAFCLCIFPIHACDCLYG